jgi:hypothetical protein
MSGSCRLRFWYDDELQLGISNGIQTMEGSTDWRKHLLFLLESRADLRDDMPLELSLLESLGLQGPRKILT